MARSSNLNEDGQASGNEDVSIPDEAFLTTSDSEDSESYGERASEARAYAAAQEPEVDTSDLFAQLVAEGTALGGQTSSSDSATEGTSTESVEAPVISASAAVETDSTNDSVISEEDVVTEDGSANASDVNSEAVVSGDANSDASITKDEVGVDDVVVKDDSAIAEDSGDWTESASSDDFVDYSDSDPAAE